MSFRHYTPTPERDWSRLDALIYAAGAALALLSTGAHAESVSWALGLWMVGDVVASFAAIGNNDLSPGAGLLQVAIDVIVVIVLFVVLLAMPMVTLAGVATFTIPIGIGLVMRYRVLGAFGSHAALRAFQLLAIRGLVGAAAFLLVLGLAFSFGVELDVPATGELRLPREVKYVVLLYLATMAILSWRWHPESRLYAGMRIHRG